MAKTRKNTLRTTRKRGGATAPKAPSSQSVESWEKWVEKYKAYLEKEGKHVPATPTWSEHKSEPRYRNSRGESVITTKDALRGQELKWMHNVYYKLTGKTHKTLSRSGLF
jgi:hypothetical protein